MSNRFPIGAIIPYVSETLPSNHLHCDGSQIDRTVYASLFAVIGTAWGNGDGSTTFHLPDLRGRFLRGYDHGASNDPNKATRTACNSGGATGDNVGSVQAGDYLSHVHYFLSGIAQWHKSSEIVTGGGGAVVLSGSTPSTGSNTGSETRPQNAGFMFIIRYI